MKRKKTAKKPANIDESAQSGNRPKVFISTEFDVITTDDEEWEPPIRREWDEWDDKVNGQDQWTLEDKTHSQEYWTREKLLERKRRHGQFDDHDKVYKKKTKTRSRHRQ